MSNVLIRVNNLSKAYPSGERPLEVLRDVNLEIQQGDYAVLIGSSGSGKTTFWNMVTGIDSPTNGDITIGDLPITGTEQSKLTRWRARNIGLVFQFAQFLPTLTVVENVMVPMDFANVRQSSVRKRHAIALLDRLGIADQAEKTPDMLSGGQQQRVAVARALANDPPLIICDEPTASLDHMSAQNVFSILRERTQQGTTVLIVTPDRDLAEGFPTIYALHNGNIKRATVQEVAKRRTQELRVLRAEDNEPLDNPERGGNQA